MASNSIGNVALILSADGSQVQQVLQASTGQVQQFATQSQGILGNLGSSLGSIFSFGAVGAAIGAVVATVTSGFSRITQLGKDLKLADALNVSPEAFQGMSLILQRAGHDASETGNFFAEFATKIDKAASLGRGPLAHALADLGVDMQALKSQSIDEQFLTLADVIQKIGPGAQAAALAVHAFGDASLLPQLLQGRAGITGFLDEARASGRILSGDQARAAQETARAWETAKRTLSAAWQSVSTEIAVALTPVIQIASDIFKGVVDVAGPAIKGLGEVFRVSMEVLGPVFQGVVAWIKSVVDAVKDWAAQTGVQLPTIREVVLSVFQAIGVAGAYTWDTLKAGVGGLAFSMSYLVEAIGNVADAYNALSGVTTHFADAGVAVRNWARGAVTSFGQSATAVNQFFDNLRKKKDEANANPLRPPAPPQRRPDQFEYHATGAFLQGSKEAYSIEVQSKLASQLGVAPVDLQERIAEAGEETVAALGRIEDRLSDRPDPIEIRQV